MLGQAHIKGYHVNQSHIVAQESPYYGRYDNPGQEIRKEKYGLINLCEIFIVEFADNKGQGYGKHNAADYHDHIVKKRISDDYPNVRVTEKEFEIIKSHPSAVGNTINKTA
jgi:hypothetical protein